jgi:hypothetical protein
MRRGGNRKAYVGILALALGALAVDRLVLGSGLTGPKSASANPQELVAAPEAAPPVVIRPVVRLAERLDLIRESEAEASDAFAAPSWLAEKKAAPAAAAQPPAEPFDRRHRLRGIARGADGTLTAMIDDRTLRVGDEIDAHILRSVDMGARTAVFEGPYGVVRLSIPVGDVGNKRRSN